MFYVGQKVVCVDNGPLETGLAATSLSKGRIYTVTKCGAAPNGGAAVWVAEATARYPGYGFLPHRFRPVVERKTDISIFTDMLTPKTAEVSP